MAAPAAGVAPVNPAAPAAGVAPVMMAAEGGPAPAAGGGPAPALAPDGAGDNIDRVRRIVERAKGFAKSRDLVAPLLYTHRIEAVLAALDAREKMLRDADCRHGRAVQRVDEAKEGLAGLLDELAQGPTIPSHRSDEDEPAERVLRVNELGDWDTAEPEPKRPRASRFVEEEAHEFDEEAEKAEAGVPGAGAPVRTASAAGDGGAFVANGAEQLAVRAAKRVLDVAQLALVRAVNHRNAVGKACGKVAMEFEKELKVAVANLVANEARVIQHLLATNRLLMEQKLLAESRAADAGVERARSALAEAEADVLVAQDDVAQGDEAQSGDPVEGLQDDDAEGGADDNDGVALAILESWYQSTATVVRQETLSRVLASATPPPAASTAAAATAAGVADQPAASCFLAWLRYAVSRYEYTPLNAPARLSHTVVESALIAADQNVLQTCPASELSASLALAVRGQVVLSEPPIVWLRASDDAVVGHNALVLSQRAAFDSAEAWRGAVRADPRALVRTFSFEAASQWAVFRAIILVQVLFFCVHSCRRL